MADTRLTFHRPPGGALGCCCFRSNGLQSRCQQFHLSTIAGEQVYSVHGRRRRRASDDDIIVGVRWELGGMVVDRTVRLGDGDSEK